MKAMMDRPPTIREIDQAKRDWMEAIQPLIAQRATILGLGGMRVAINADGSLGQTEYVMTDEQQQLLDQVDELIETMKPAILKNLPQQ